jgi:guanylate kinase
VSGLLVVVSGPSGAGKSTVLKRLIADVPRCRFSVSMTTRAPRPGEVDGRDYLFVTESQFVSAVEANGFLEHATVHGSYYGTPRAYVQSELDKGFDIVLDIDVQGAAKVRESHPEGVFIFLAPPSLAELERRLRKRGTETPASLERRIGHARQEMEQANQYEYVVVNEDGDKGLDAALGQLKAILVAEACRTRRKPGFFFDALSVATASEVSPRV